MGGEGSGRLPNPETIAKKMEGVHEPKFFLPAGGIGGVKPEAKRSDSSVLLKSGDNISLLTNDVPYITSFGAETDPIWMSMSGNYYLASNPSGYISSYAETDPKFMALSGNLSYAAPLGADDNYVTDAEKIVIGNTSGTNTGNQTSIVGITGTKAQFDTAVSDGNIAYATGAFHDGFSDFVANEHIDWTSTSSNLFTTGSLSGNSAKIGTLSGNAIRTLEDHSTSGNSAVVGIITHTSATPPTASNFPIGTIYIQYTA